MSEVIEKVKILKYLSEKKDEIFEFLDLHRRILLHANPSSGKTTLFADFCIEHSKNKKDGRIIFCCPFLIIQEQFKERLASKGIQIDFELNHKAGRKKLNEFDKIITSTFHSFKHILGQLNEQDTIIVDEAHAILFRYKKYESNTYTYFTDFTKCLYKTESKLVLMTGTPHSALSVLFNLAELKIRREEVSSTINIQYTKEKIVNIALAFAENCLNQFDSKHLNIIYIKSKNKCLILKELIEKNLEVQALVLTSDEKDSEDYKTLVKQAIIPEHYQFLVTTNVISTGTNVLNDNIGRALMLDENNPVEIKQFCKRFRNKPEIEVDIINPPYSVPEINLEEERDYWKDQRNELRLIYKQLLEKLNEIRIKQEQYSEVEEIQFNNLDSSPYQMIDTCIEQFLIQEIYFDSQIKFTYNSPEELVKALNEFDDVMSVQVDNYSSTYTKTNYNENEIIKLQKEQLNELFDHILLSSIHYLSASYDYLITTANIFLKHKLENIIDIKGFDKNTDETIKNNVSNYSFLNEVLIPFIEYYPYFKDIEKTIYFLKTTNRNKRSPLKVSLYFNSKFHEFFDVEKTQTKAGLSKLSLKAKKSASTPTDRFVLQFLKYTFQFLTLNDYIDYDDLAGFLIQKEMRLPRQLKTPIDFPFDRLLFFKETGIIKGIQKGLIIGLARSIFKLETIQKSRNDKNKKRKKAYLFEQNIVNYDEELSMFASKDLLLEKTNSKFFEYNCITNKHDSLNLNSSTRILIDSYGLINNVLGDNYYKMKLKRIIKNFS